MNENRSLYIPVNTPDADDRIMGLGDKELFIIGGMTIITFILCMAMVNSSGKMVIIIATGMIVIATTVLIIRKDIYRENLIKKIKILRNFSKSQKKYDYLYFNIYEGYVKSKEEKDEG